MRVEAYHTGARRNLREILPTLGDKQLTVVMRRYSATAKGFGTLVHHLRLFARERGLGELRSRRLPQGKACLWLENTDGTKN